MEAYFFAVEGAAVWPISLPRNLMPRTRSIFPRMILLGIPLMDEKVIVDQHYA
jgi:hypothetical protein